MFRKAVPTDLPLTVKRGASAEFLGEGAKRDVHSHGRKNN